MDAYLIDKWLEMPYAARQNADIPYDKYHYKDGESVGSIARIISRPWKKFTPHDIFEFNWGMITRTSEVNYYLKRHTLCTLTDRDDQVYKLAAADGNPFLWVPRAVRKFDGRYTSPGRVDVGHVALDDAKSPQHIDTLVIRPSYSISLELGDVDALFDPVTPGADPATCPGIWQRLQVLGYHYIPLGNHAFPAAKRQSAMRIVWDHYRKIHTPKGEAAHIRPPTNAELVAILKQELQNNLLSVVKNNVCAESGAILDGRLPDPPLGAALPEEGAEGPERPAVEQEYARIRIPGGYCATHGQFNTGLVYHNSIQYGIGADRHTLEAEIVDHCTLTDNTTKLLGKIPIIARVYRIYPDGKEEPADGVTVYFQLVAPPHPLPDQCVVKAPELRNEEMNYGLADRTICTIPNWKPAYVQVSTAVTQAEVLDMARKVSATPTGDRTKKLDDLVVAKNVPAKAPFATWDPSYTKTAPASVSESDLMVIVQTKAAQRRTRLNLFIFENATNQAERVSIRADVDHHVARIDAEITKIKTDVDEHVTWADNNPLVIDNTGPKRFVDDVYKDQGIRYVVADDDDPQKHNADRHYGGTRRVAVQGENIGGTNYPGVFEIAGADRPGFHERRDTQHADYGTLSRAVAITDATEKTEHPYAVKATANDQGYAGVIFTPSRCGGDAYRLRAYVGPPTLQYDGKDAEGPVVDTGTMVVWRNIRLHRYVQIRKPAVVGADIKDIYENAANPKAPVHGGGGWDFSKWWDSHDCDKDPPEVNLCEVGVPGGKQESIYPAADARTLKVQFISLVEQFKRCYCELIVDQRAKTGANKGQVDRTSQAITPAEHREAYDKAKAAAAAHTVPRDDGTSVAVDWDTLLVDPVGTAPHMFAVRLPQHYNGLVAAPAQLEISSITEICNALGYKAIGAFIEHFTGDGVLGMSIVQGVWGCSWDDMTYAPGLNGATVLTSGVADRGRGVALFYSDKIYRGTDMMYSVTANAAHELGHALTRCHQPPEPNNGDANHHQPQADPALTPTVAAEVPGALAGDRDVGDCTCVMGYQGCFGEFCGRCVLALRGWKTGVGTVEEATG